MRAHYFKWVVGFFGMWMTLISQSASCKTTIIHAVGIDSQRPVMNQYGFYDSAKRVVEYCKKKRLFQTDSCHVYIDSSTEHMNAFDQEINLTAEQPHISGKFESSKILTDLKEALAQASSGDQIVFSLSNHGAPQAGVSKSCIFSGDDKICDADLRSVLKNRKPGVRVLIIADACFSGGFAELNNQEVCVFAAADRRVESLRSDPTLIWKELVYRKDESPVTLSELRGMFHFSDNDGGGFASDIIRDRLCEKNNVPNPSSLFNQTYDYLSNYYAFAPSKALNAVSGVSANTSALAHLLDGPSCHLKSEPFPINEMVDFDDNLKKVLGLASAESNSQSDFEYFEKMFAELCTKSSRDPYLKLCSGLESVLRLKNKIIAWRSDPEILKLLSQVHSLERGGDLFSSFHDRNGRPYRRIPSIDRVTASDAQLGSELEKDLALHAQLASAIKQRLINDPEFESLKKALSAVADQVCFPKFTDKLLKFKTDRAGKWSTIAKSFKDDLDISEEKLIDARKCEDTFLLP